MEIEDDFEVFRFARFLNGVQGSEEGTAALCEYWKNIGKLDKLLLFTGGFSVFPQFTEIQYLVTSEACCERLYRALENFIGSQCCSKEVTEAVVSAETIAAANDLVNKLRALKDVRLRNSWAEFFKALSEHAAKIVSAVGRLTALEAAGQQVRFSVTATAEHILAGTANYNSPSGNYFLFRYKTQ